MSDFEKNTWVNVNGWQYPTFVVGDSTHPEYVNVYTSVVPCPDNSVEKKHVSQLTVVDCPAPFEKQYEDSLDEINEVANREDWITVYSLMDELMENFTQENHPAYNQNFVLFQR